MENISSFPTGQNRDTVEEKFIKSGLRKIFFTVLCILISGMICTSLYAHSDGAPIGCLGGGVDKFNWNLYGARSTFTCGNLGCHYQYPVNIGKGKFSLFVVDKCEPGQTVDILISFEKTNTEIHGFEIAAQDRYYNRIVGTFIVDDDDMQVIGGGLYVTHTKKGTNRKYWQVKWQAPPADFLVQNPVRFYAMGVEGDNDGTAMGDYIYKATRVIEVAPKKEKKQQVRIIKKE